MFLRLLARYGLVVDSVVRKAENEAIFRDANEEIRAARTELGLSKGRTPFFCECDDSTCREVVRLSLGEYEAVRQNAATFLVASGHPHSSSRVVAEFPSYVVIEKLDEAREVAIETDPRSRDG